MLIGFYCGTILYEKSILKIVKDSIFLFLPFLFWIFLVSIFSEFSLNEYFLKYYNHYFNHPSGGELNFSLNKIKSNFSTSEIFNWGIADFLRILISPILFIYVVISSKEEIVFKGIGKFQILSPVFFIYGWFWLLSPAKSIIYSGLFTTYVLMFTSYYLVFEKKQWNFFTISFSHYIFIFFKLKHFIFFFLY